MFFNSRNWVLWVLAIWNILILIPLQIVYIKKLCAEKVKDSDIMYSRNIVTEKSSAQKRLKIVILCTVEILWLRVTTLSISQHHISATCKLWVRSGKCRTRIICIYSIAKHRNGGVNHIDGLTKVVVLIKIGTGGFFSDEGTCLTFCGQSIMKKIIQYTK